MQPQRIVLVVALASCFTSCKLLGITNKKVDFEHPEVTTPSGVLIQDLLEGQGPPIVVGDEISAHVIASVQGETTPFFSSSDMGVPLEIVVGSFEDLRGLNDGLIGMKAGGERKVTLPPDQAYGEEGVQGAVEPGATLIVLIELLSIATIDI
jgi:FKBP-type peptidyl-prolyl cis-trans isomerase